MFRTLLVVVAIAGCGRVDFVPRDPPDAALRTYRDAVLEDTPVAYWRLADSGTVAIDETGRADGTYSGTCLQGATGALAGDTDPAVQFDGATCRLFVTPTAFDGRAPFSVEVWVFPISFTTSSTTDSYFMHETRSGSNPVDGYAIVTENLTGTYFERVGGGAAHSLTRVMLATGVYHHVVGTYDGNTLRMYIDGVIASMSGNQVDETVDSTGAKDVIGGFPSTTPFGVPDGSIDEVALYDHELAADRVATHYRIATQGPEPR